MYFSFYTLNKIDIMSKSQIKSPNSGNENKNVDKIPQKMPRKRKTAKQLVTQHLKDPNHVITDQDLQNVNIESSVSSDTTHDPLTIPESHERPKDEGKDHPIATPWDVLKD
jgi:hypothetical protein